MLSNVIFDSVWWFSGMFGALCLEGLRFESHSGHHIGTLGKSFIHSCLWRFGVLTLTQYTASVGLAQGPYLVVRVGFEPATLWMHGTKHTTELLCPSCCVYVYNQEFLDFLFCFSFCQTYSMA